jgi:FlaA1/EpsC-like NDP-sugar epimerase
MVLFALQKAWGGELFVPKIPSFKITDLAEAIGPDCQQQIIGIRSGEKIHEEMITSSDSFTTYDIGNYYVILPITTTWDKNDFINKFNAKKVPEGFVYNSKNNGHFLSVNEIRKLINENVDSNFFN